MFVERERLYQYIQPQELEQREAMNPDAVSMAYESAVGRIDSEIGYIYNLRNMLAKEGNDRDQTLLLLVTVFMCITIVGNSIQIAPMLQEEYVNAQKKLKELKDQNSTLLDAEKKDLSESNARIEIVSNRGKYLG